MNDEQRQGSPLKSIEDLFKTIITTAGIMLPLLWGLTQRITEERVLSTIRIASIVFMAAIVWSVLGSQFIVTQLERDAADISKKRTVAYSFILAWVCFIVGVALVIVAIFQFRLPAK